MTCLEGGCHCGAITLRFTTDLALDALVPRADQCSFCRKHNAAVVSDPAGQLDIVIAERAGPAYRFGLEITDFHLCRQCGVFVAATGIGDDPLRGVVNVHALRERERLSRPPVAVGFDGETIAERQARRRQHWTPASVARQKFSSALAG
jgi:hypothetical protein